MKFLILFFVFFSKIDVIKKRFLLNKHFQYQFHLHKNFVQEYQWDRENYSDQEKDCGQEEVKESQV